MLERIEQAAQLSVSRACAFGGLTIVTFMVGFASAPALCFKLGGILVLLMAAVLLLKAFRVAKQPYKSTEVWLLLKSEDRPTQDTAQRIIAGVLRETYLTFACHAAGVAAVLLFLTIVAQFFGASMWPM